MSQTYVDIPVVEMAPADTWPTLSMNQLLETKSQLQEKLYLANGRAAYVVPLQRAMGRLEAIIEQKLLNPGDF